MNHQEVAPRPRRGLYSIRFSIQNAARYERSCGVEQEAEYFGEEHGDVFAPINNSNLLNMRFLDEDEETDDDYENENAEFEFIE